MTKGRAFSHVLKVQVQGDIRIPYHQLICIQHSPKMVGNMGDHIIKISAPSQNSQQQELKVAYSQVIWFECNS